MSQSRRAWRMCLCVTVLLGTAIAGCATRARNRGGLTLGPIAGDSVSTAQGTASVSVYDDSPWRALLLKHTGPGWVSIEDAVGDEKVPPYPVLVDYKAIAAEPAELNVYLGILARTGPVSTPEAFGSETQRLAYYINAYNACAIRTVLAEYPTQTMYAPMMPAFEYDWYFQVDGRRVNLQNLRQLAWQQAKGDVRALFGLCGAAIGSAPLSSQPYQPQDVYDNLGAQMRDCLAMPQILRVSHDQQQLQLWSQIVRQRKDFFDYYERMYGSRPASLLSVMLDLCPVRQRPELNRAIGYKVVEIPFDRRLNDLVVRADGALSYGERAGG